MSVDVGDGTLVCAHAARDVLAADLDGDHLLVAQGRGKVAAPEAVLRRKGVVVAADQTVCATQKRISIYGPSLRSRGSLRCRPVYKYDPAGSTERAAD